MLEPQLCTVESVSWSLIHEQNILLSQNFSMIWSLFSSQNQAEFMHESVLDFKSLIQWFGHIDSCINN